MIEAQKVKLSTEILDELSQSIDNIIYGEWDEVYEMGNPGGAILYCLAGETFTRYEVSRDEDIRL